jgi:hypothetical protein
MKSTCAFLLALALLFAPGAAPDEEAAAEELDIVGVWRTENFERMSTLPPFEIFYVEHYASLYITECGNLYMPVTRPAAVSGHITVVQHYRYEIVDGKVELTFVEVDLQPVALNYAWLTVLDDGNILLEIRPAETSPHPAYTTSFTFYRAPHRLPFGWTQADVQEIQRRHTRI